MSALPSSSNDDPEVELRIAAAIAFSAQKEHIVPATIGSYSDLSAVGQQEQEQSEDLVRNRAMVGPVVVTLRNHFAIQITGANEEKLDRIATQWGINATATWIIEEPHAGRTTLIYRRPAGMRVRGEQRTMDVRILGEGDVIPAPGSSGATWYPGMSPDDVAAPAEAPAALVKELDLIPTEDAPRPDFPLDQLPPVIANFAISQARTTKIAVDTAVLAAISGLFACISRRSRVRVGGTHMEVPVWWLAVALPSGERKTAILKGATRALFTRQAELMKVFDLQLRDWKNEMAIIDSQIQRLTKECGKDNIDNARNREAILTLERERDRKPRPPSPRITVGDATVQAILRDMSEQAGAGYLITDEGGLFRDLADPKSGVKNYDGMLQGHSGTTIDHSRITRERVFIAVAILNIFIFLQPNLLDEMLRNKQFRAKGFQARFLPIYPKSMVGRRDYEDIRPDAEAEQAFGTVVFNLFDVGEGEIVYTIEGEALAVWKEFHDRIEHEQAPGGRLNHIADWASKQAGNVARLAMLLHAVEARNTQPRAVSRLAVERAVAIADRYLIPHALYAFRNVDVPVAKEAPDADQLIEEFIAAKLTLRPGTPVLRNDVYLAYVDFVEARGATPRSKNALGRRVLRIHGVEPCRSGHDPAYKGLTLNLGL